MPAPYKKYVLVLTINVSDSFLRKDTFRRIL